MKKYQRHDHLGGASLDQLGDSWSTSSHLPTHSLTACTNMNLFTAQVYPGEALGFLVLGSTLHNILTALKAEPQRFPKLDLIYSPSQPVVEPIILTLPLNGIRLRFDGPEQRLRLIEIIDFSRNKLTYKNIDVAKPACPGSYEHAGPKFRHVYDRLFGPTYLGEYVGPDSSLDDESGVYVLSYPGVAFSFPIAGPPDEGKLLSVLSSATLPAVSMAIFTGESWAKARLDLYTRMPKIPSLLGAPSKGLELYPEEIGLVKILGGGRLELVRQWANSPFTINLNRTTPQELVAELGPPDAIYRKNDQRLSIHTGAGNRRRGSNAHLGLQDDSTDTDQSSAHTITDDSDEEFQSENVGGKLSGECFYNYFYHGFDVLISTPSEPSQPPPEAPIISTPPVNHSAHLVATKMLLHSNVPGSYPFNRHRRCRWELDYLNDASPNNHKKKQQHDQEITNSETPFSLVSSRLSRAWESIYASEEQARQHQRGMVLNRGWGDSPGSSCELLGGWEDSLGGKRKDAISDGGGNLDEDNGLGNTTLFGFPGLIFEVLRNGAVSGLTVF